VVVPPGSGYPDRLMVVSALRRLAPASLGRRSFSVRLPKRRPRMAWAVAIAGPAVITVASRLVGSSIPPASALLSILLMVVIIALLGGWRPALTAVVVGLAAQEILFSFPYGSLNDHEPAQLSVLVAFVAIGTAVGILVDELTRLTSEQAALRRIATLVAQAAPPEQVFAAVTEEVGRLRSVEYAHLGRYERDGTMTIVASSGRRGGHVPVGRRWTLGGKNISTLVFETGRPARIDGYTDASGPVGLAAREDRIGSGVGTPVIVDGHLWGVVSTHAPLGERMSANTEARLASFTELVATAIANAESHAALARLAEEQAALRRVATLVARAAPPDELFACVTAEVGQLLRADRTTMSRYESDGTTTIIATWSSDGAHVPVGTRRRLGGKNLATLVSESGASERIDSYADSSGDLAGVIRGWGVRAAVGTPITVGARLWGVMIAGSVAEQPFPVDSETRLASFTDLVATAIANAESRADLTASRARIVATADETRRRIERDLHDGAQQRLVSLGLELRAVQAAVPPQLDELEAELSRIADEFGNVLDELRELARGIHPATLAEGGLGPALKAVARRCPVPVKLDLRTEARMPERVEVAAYYVLSEALTNVAKHAQASVVHVRVELVDGSLRVFIRDDGAGGAAAPTRGSGLVGIRDRVEALDGTLTIQSTVGEGTSLHVTLPVND
jgi:signal transduction histidine kinase